MGWVKEPKMSNKEIFNEIVKNMPTWRGIPNDSSSPYEFFADYLRDYYEVTLYQCDEICKMLKEYYQISKFYYCE